MHYIHYEFEIYACITSIQFIFTQHNLFGIHSCTNFNFSMSDFIIKVNMHADTYVARSE